MGATWSDGEGPPIPRRDHENQIRNLRKRHERRKREITETWQTRYDKLQAEIDLNRQLYGATAVVAGVSILVLMRSRSAARTALTALQSEAHLVRHRAKEEVVKVQQLGSKKIVEDILGVSDNLQRAVDSATEIEDTPLTAQSVLDGVKMIKADLAATLAKHGVEKIDADVGTTFDPNVHDGVSKIFKDDEEVHTIAGVIRDGYTLNGIVIRPAMVSVYARNDVTGEGGS